MHVCGVDYVRCIAAIYFLCLYLVINIASGSDLKKFQLIHSVNVENCKPGLMIKL